VDPSTGAVAGVPTPNPDVPENDWSLGAVVGTTIRVDWIAPGANGVLVEVAEWGLNSPVTTPTNAVIDTAGITLNFGSTPNPGDTIIYSGAALQSATPYSRPKTQSKTV
jgi:hypothetical protein